MPQRPPYFSITLLSAGSLAYEVLLMRLFSIIQWHHFAYMIIGLALLGYGISGTFVSIAQKIILPRFRLAYIISALLFGLSSVACFIIAQAIPFNAEQILWDERQIFYLLYIFLLLAIPFLFAASAICLAFMRFHMQISRIYAMDLLGAGVGSLGIVLLLYVVFPQSALIIIGVVGLCAAIIAMWELKSTCRLWTGLGTLLIMGLLMIVTQSFELNISPYKGLEQILRVTGTKIIEQRSSPLGLLSVVASSDVPLRHAPGLSLNASQEPPPQLGIFTDADNMTVITQSPGRSDQLAYLDQMTSALPYHLKKAKQVLIVGSGGGMDILQADYHNVSQIDAVELNPQLINLVRDKYNEFAGGLYLKKNIAVHIDEARGYLAKSKKNYDVIQLALIDAFTASASGLYALNESYLYTTEALQLYLSHVVPGGYLALTRWIKMPPRDTLKLFATAIDALKKSGVRFPQQQLVLIRSWQTSTLLIKNGAFSEEELNIIQAFCHVRSFDMAYTSTMSSGQANRFNIFTQPIFYVGAVSLLGDERESFLEKYKFNLEPATDNQPYFHHFFKWSVLPEIMALRSQGGMSLFEWGYMILIATLVIAAVTSVALVISPLYFLHHFETDLSNKIKFTQVVFYFFFIGLAFLFIEIAFIQKFILFLHHPIFAIAVTLTAFLVFAGLGSNWSARFSQHRPDQQAVLLAVLGVTLLCLMYLFILESLFGMLVALPTTIKIGVTVLLIAPLAFFMGMPFPLGLASVASHAQHLIPWAWGINGCASVISAVLATLLAIHFGFTAVVLLAMLLYIAVVFVFPKPRL